MDIGPPELIILVVVILLMFGGSQIPKLARNLGKAQHEFKSAFEEGQRDNKPAAVADAVPVAPATPVVPAAVTPVLPVAVEATPAQDHRIDN